MIPRPVRAKVNIAKVNMTNSIRIFKLLVSAMVLLPACGLVRAQTNSAPARKDSAVYAALARVPSKGAARRNPLEADPDAVKAGAKLFEQHCAECHGRMGEGGKKGPSLQAAEVQETTSGTLFWLLTNGVVRRGMPVWSKLPEPQRWQLVSYIKSLTPAAQPAPGAETPPQP